MIDKARMGAWRCLAATEVFESLPLAEKTFLLTFLHLFPFLFNMFYV